MLNRELPKVEKCNPFVLVSAQPLARCQPFGKSIVYMMLFIFICCLICSAYSTLSKTHANTKFGVQ